MDTHDLVPEQGADPGTLTSATGALVNLDAVLPGSLLNLETATRVYQVECLGGSEVRISGHPRYCPEPVRAHIFGSINRHGVLEAGVIGRGSRVMFSMGDQRPITTSRVVRLQLARPKKNPIKPLGVQ